VETGWLPTTPGDDNVVRRFIRNQGALNEAFAAACIGRVQHTDDVFLADAGSVVPYVNQAVLTRPLTGPDDAVVDLVDDFFPRTRPATLLSVWPTPDLSPRGWVLAGHPMFVVRAPGPVPTTLRRPGVDVELVTTPDLLERAERVIVEGYPIEEAADAAPLSVLPERLLGSRVHVRLGRVDGEPAAAANVYVDEGVVNLCMAATLPDARRRGVWQALVWDRVDEAPDLPAVAFTSDDSRPGFVAMGFLPMLRLTLWFRPPTDDELVPATP
jgi:hypothetical protein